MSYDFASAWAAAGMEKIVTTTQLVTSGPSVQPTAGSLGELAPKTVASTALVEHGPTVTPTPGTVPTENASGRREWDHYGDFNFVIELDGISAGAFQKCDGLTFDVDLIEYKDSMDPYPRYRPGIRRFGKIKLTKGHIDNAALWDWCQNIMEGKHDRRHGAIHVMSDDGQDEVVTYQFLDAFPIQWSGFKLDGKGTATLIEEITLVTECVIRG